MKYKWMNVDGMIALCGSQYRTEFQSKCAGFTIFWKLNFRTQRLCWQSKCCICPLNNQIFRFFFLLLVFFANYLSILCLGDLSAGSRPKKGNQFNETITWFNRIIILLQKFIKYQFVFELYRPINKLRTQCIEIISAYEMIYGVRIPSTHNFLLNNFSIKW